MDGPDHLMHDVVITLPCRGPTTTTMSSKHAGASYHLETTGEAARTAAAHQTEEDIVLFGACFCPFVHREPAIHPMPDDMV